MKAYRCKHTVDAVQWIDTDENREAISDWFDRHGAVFGTRGPVVVLPEGGEVDEGEWILLEDGEFLAMDDETFRADYEETAP